MKDSICANYARTHHVLGLSDIIVTAVRIA